MSDKKFPIFRRTGNGEEFYCVLSESLALRLIKRKTYTGITVVQNKIAIDDAINDNPDTAFHTITKEEFGKAFGEVSDTIAKTATIMDELIK